MRTHRFGAFTLVELLVVIGIIAALIGILLPVLSGVQARGRDIKCQSNLRQIVQAINGYAAENKGSLPYGFYYNRSINKAHPDPNNPANSWDEAPDNSGSMGDPDNQHPFISWASLVGRYMVKRAHGDNMDVNFPPVLQCPEAAQAWAHIVGYIGHLVAMPMPFNERAFYPGPPIQFWYKPPTLSGVFPHTALVWDTSVSNGLENSVGYLGSADLDGQDFWRGAQFPQYRFFDSTDRYAQSPNPGLNRRGNNKPVRLTTTGAPVFKNIDPNDPNPSSNFGPGIPYQGNLRFRHNKNTACNVGFADGSVRQFTCKMNPDKSVYDTKHDALRKHFLLKWPAGMPRSLSVP